MRNDASNKLLKRNNFLKSKLLHEQVKHGNFPFKYSKKQYLSVIEEYKHTKSLLKSALRLGINPNEVLSWYVQGQLNNPEFRGFYLAINKLNDECLMKTEDDEVKNVQGEYIISEYGDGWSYKTFVNGEKIFIISDDLKRLKDKVKSRNLPID